MLTLNLLPEPYKEEYRFEKKKRFVVSVGISLSLILFVFNALLVSAYIFITIYRTSFESNLKGRETAEVTVRLERIKKQIRSVNTKVTTLAGIEHDIVSVAPVLERIALLIRPEIYVSTFSFDTVSGAVQLAGFAETRNAVLALEKALAESDFVDPGSVKGPISNILKEENIRFTFTFQLHK